MLIDSFNYSLTGKKVKLIYTSDQYTNLKYGDTGVVEFIDDAGTMFVKWDNGSNLGLIAGEDKWTYIDE